MAALGAGPAGFAFGTTMRHRDTPNDPASAALRARQTARRDRPARPWIPS
jgi:hypothetical protein